MSSPSLTVVIPALNEARDIPDTLRSLQGLTKDIIVVDSGSSDQTVEIAKNFGAQVISHKFSSFSDTRNFGDDHAKGQWILSIEADVTISSDLAKEIIEAIISDKYDAYFIGRLNKIWGKYIYYTDWGPSDDRHIWLYKGGVGQWQGDVHEEFKTKERVGSLKNHLLHKNYKTVSEFIEKINRFSDLATKQGQKFPNWWFLRDFFKRYIYKLGFLDGYRGLFLSYLQATYYLTLSIKNFSSKQR